MKVLLEKLVKVYADVTLSLGGCCEGALKFNLPTDGHDKIVVVDYRKKVIQAALNYYNQPESLRNIVPIQKAFKEFAKLTLLSDNHTWIIKLTEISLREVERYSGNIGFLFSFWGADHFNLYIKRNDALWYKIYKLGSPHYWWLWYSVTDNASTVEWQYQSTRSGNIKAVISDGFKIIINERVITRA